MSTPPSPPRRTVLLSFRFLGTALIGSLVMALVAAFAPPPAQLAVLGAFVSILGGLFVSYVEQEEARDRRRAEAIERLAVPLILVANSFDLVLLDVRLPRVNGIDVARRLRAGGNAVPIIAVTANAFPGDCEECLAAGMDAYLPKPFTLSELLTQIAVATASL